MESNEHERDHNVTQVENPGAQGDLGAGQGDAGDQGDGGDGGDESTIVETPPLIEGDEQPRSDEQPGNEQI